MHAKRFSLISTFATTIGVGGLTLRFFLLMRTLVRAFFRCHNSRFKALKNALSFSNRQIFRGKLVQVKEKESGRIKSSHAYRTLHGKNYRLYSSTVQDIELALFSLILLHI